MSGFAGKERNSDLDYRWSLQSAVVIFPGIGNEPVNVSISTIGFRPDGKPPVISVQARGRTYTVQTAPGLHTDELFLERGNILGGNLSIR